MSKIRKKDIEEIERAVEARVPNDPLYKKFTLEERSLPKKLNSKE